MNSLIKNIKFIIILFFLINIFLLDIFLVKGKINISNGTDILQAIVATVNLLFLVYFYYKDSRKKIEESKNSINQYWYHDLIISKNINMVEQMYNDIINGIEFSTLENNIEVKIKIGELKSSIKKVKNSLGPLLDAFNSNFNYQVMEKLLELEDVTTLTYVKVLEDSSKSNEFYEVVRKHQGELYLLMYEYDIRMI